jgi:hypothetical protein
MAIYLFSRSMKLCLVCKETILNVDLRNFIHCCNMSAGYDTLRNSRQGQCKLDYDVQIDYRSFNLRQTKFNCGSIKTTAINYGFPILLQYLPLFFRSLSIHVKLANLATLMRLNAQF